MSSATLASKLQGICLSDYEARIFGAHCEIVCAPRALLDSAEGERLPIAGVDAVFEASWQTLVEGLEYGANSAPRTLR